MKVFRMSFMIVGGGVAGVSCAKALRKESPDAQISVVCSGPLVKTVGQFAEHFDVHEEKASSAFDNENVKIVNATVVGWDPAIKVLRLDDGQQLSYDKLCIATGASPRCLWHHPRVLTIRDTWSARELCKAVANSRHILLVGNGGIATEIVFELHNAKITWVVRDRSIATPYFDASTAEFFANAIKTGRQQGWERISKREKFGETSTSSTKVAEKSETPYACALGPDWATSMVLHGSSEKRSVELRTEVEVSNLEFVEDEVAATLTDGTRITCDLVIWATGVEPNSGLWKRDCQELALAEDGGIVVDQHFQSSIPDVYACGDVCTVGWKSTSDWQQMRLWTQARQMGDFCGRAMCNPNLPLDFCFEFFAHVTTFFGFKVVLLGDFKGTRQPPGWYPIERIKEGEEFVRAIMFEHRMKGAILVGETNLEETFENLILNGTDLTGLEPDFLDPNIDIEDYFD